MAYQSLYRRYRPRRFAELVGQDHVVRALRNAVAAGRVGHAYLFSGPRGTGKTSSARILAKVLNCERPVDGEPCCQCSSCLAVETGTSFDVHELDAASNNGVENIRDLIEKANLGTPGRRKVYILDEVHMLSKPAEAALLKTLEEPPDHVVFVLATTDPQKVSPTIRSRCQPLNFHLLPAHELAGHVRHVIADAELTVSDETIEAVLREGGGSARDTLSALEQAVAAGGLDSDGGAIDEVIEALAERDTARALSAVAAIIAGGRDARSLTERVVAQLRDAFLSLMAPDLVQLGEASAARVADQARRLGAAATVRAMEVLGETLVEFRHAPDPRLLVDVALVRLTTAAADTNPAALAERLERLERLVAQGAGSPAASASSMSAPAQSGTRPTLGSKKALNADSAREADATAAGDAAGADSPVVSPPSSPASPGSALGAPTRDALTLVWADQVLPRLKPLTKALFAAGRFLASEGSEILFALPNEPHRAKCEAQKAEVEAVLAAQFTVPVRLKLVLDRDTAAANSSPDRPIAPTARRLRPAGDTELPEEEAIDPDSLVIAGDVPSALERLTQAFPGAEIVREDAR